MEFFLYLCGTKVAKGKDVHLVRMLKFNLFSFTYCIIQLLCLFLSYKFKTI